LAETVGSAAAAHQVLTDGNAGAVLLYNSTETFEQVSAGELTAVAEPALTSLDLS
jgi:hypothetical protein